MKSIIEKVGSDLKWVTVQFTPNSFYAVRHRSFSETGYGDQIMILFNDPDIYINIIDDPERTPSLLTINRDRRNVRGLIEAIRHAEQNDALS